MPYKYYYSRTGRFFNINGHSKGVVVKNRSEIGYFIIVKVMYILLVKNISFKMMNQIEQIQDLQIHSDLDYNSQEDTHNASTSSTQEYQHVRNDPQMQLAFVQRKYQKYKALRKQLYARQESQKKDGDSDISSFSGSSLSSLNQKEMVQNASAVLAKANISSQTLQLLISKFQAMTKRKQPITFKKISTLSKLDIVTVEDIFSIWKKDPTVEGRITADSFQNGDKQDKVTLVPTEKMLNKERAKAIEHLLSSNPYMTFNQIYLQLNKMNHLRQIKFGKYKEISRTTVTRLLNDSPFKQARLRVLHPNRNDPNIVQIRYQFCGSFLNIYGLHRDILFLDEHSFEMFRASDCMWIRPEKQHKNEQNNMQKDQFSLITVFDLRGGAFFKISKEGKQKYDDFNGYLNLIDQAAEANQNYPSQLEYRDKNQSSSNYQPRKFLVMDSAIIRNKQKLKKIKQLTNAKILVLPQYSPQLNPIQSWFQQLRERVRQKTYQTSLQLCQGIHSILNEYQNHDYTHFINDSIEQIKRGYNRSRF